MSGLTISQTQPSGEFVEPKGQLIGLVAAAGVINVVVVVVLVVDFGTEVEKPVS